MRETELDLLERPLHEKGPERLDDRPQTRQRHSGSDVDHQLLADAHVHHPFGMAALCLGEEASGDLRVHQRRGSVLVEEGGDGPRELHAGIPDEWAGVHRGGHAATSWSRTVATTTL